MKKPTKSFFLLALLSVTVVLSLNVNAFSGTDTYVPIGLNMKKTLPANDGGADGCDSSRFKCVMGGEAILDKETGLTWTRNPGISKIETVWQEAANLCQNCEIGNQKNWRLPTKEELMTLLDTSQSNPALPEGHPFKKVRGPIGKDAYWTSTECEGDSTYAWIITMNIGQVMESPKLLEYRIWPVRDGN